MKKHWNLTISGKVQGVWYRASAAQRAQELGLTGFVRNQPDGSVYAEVEGDAQHLEAFADWCRRGPDLAEVENVEIEADDVQHFQGFRVLR